MVGWDLTNLVMIETVDSDPPLYSILLQITSVFKYVHLWEEGGGGGG